MTSHTLISKSYFIRIWQRSPIFCRESVLWKVSSERLSPNEAIIFIQKAQFWARSWRHEWFHHLPHHVQHGGTCRSKQGHLPHNKKLSYLKCFPPTIHSRPESKRVGIVSLKISECQNGRLNPIVRQVMLPPQTETVYNDAKLWNVVAIRTPRVQNSATLFNNQEQVADEVSLHAGNMCRLPQTRLYHNNCKITTYLWLIIENRLKFKNFRLTRSAKLVETTDPPRKIVFQVGWIFPSQQFINLLLGHPFHILRRRKHTQRHSKFLFFFLNFHSHLTNHLFCLIYAPTSRWNKESILIILWMIMILTKSSYSPRMNLTRFLSSRYSLLRNRSEIRSRTLFSK